MEVRHAQIAAKYCEIMEYNKPNAFINFPMSSRNIEDNVSSTES